MEQNTEIVTHDSRTERKRFYACVKGMAEIAKGKKSPPCGVRGKAGEADA